MGGVSAPHICTYVPLRTSPAYLSCCFWECQLPIPANIPSSIPWLCSGRRNQTQCKVLLPGNLTSPLNRLEAIYIHRKTTFELVVLFSELGFIFVLIKFPLTQISIKCGSHHRQTLAIPSPPLLWKYFSQPLTLGGCTPPKYTLSTPDLLVQSTPTPCAGKGTGSGWEFYFYGNTFRFLKELGDITPGKEWWLRPGAWRPYSLLSFRVPLEDSHRTNCLPFPICPVEVIEVTTPTKHTLVLTDNYTKLPNTEAT